MSDRICFISKDNKNISEVKIPESLIDKDFYEYDFNRKCISTLIKTDEIEGNRLYGIIPDYNWVEKVKKWADKNNLIITSDYNIDCKRV